MNAPGAGGYPNRPQGGPQQGGYMNQQPQQQACCGCCDNQQDQYGQQQGCCQPDPNNQQQCCAPGQDGSSDMLHIIPLAILLLLVASGLGALCGTYEKRSLPREYGVKNSDELQAVLINHAIKKEHIRNELRYHQRMIAKLVKKANEIDATDAPPTPEPPTPSPPTDIPRTPAPPTPAPPTVAPPTNAPPTQAPPTVAPDTPAPPTPAPDTSVPDTQVPATSEPCPVCVCPTDAPPTSAPLTLVPSTSSPSTVTPAEPCVCPTSVTCPEPEPCPTPVECPAVVPCTADEPTTSTTTANATTPTNAGAPRRAARAMEHVNVDVPSLEEAMGHVADLEAAFWSDGPERRAVSVLQDDETGEEDGEDMCLESTRLVGSGGRVCRHMNADFMMYFAARHHTFRALMYFLVLLSCALYFMYYVAVTMYAGATPDSAEVTEMKSVFTIVHGFLAIWIFFLFAVEWYYFFKFINFFRWEGDGGPDANPPIRRWWQWFYESYLSSTILIGIVIVWPVIATVLRFITWPLFALLNMAMNPQFQVADAGQTRMSQGGADRSMNGTGQGGCNDFIAEMAQIPQSSLWAFLFRDRNAVGSSMAGPARITSGNVRQIGVARPPHDDGDSEMGGMPPQQQPMGMGGRVGSVTGPGQQQFGPHAGMGNAAQPGQQYPGMGGGMGLGSQNPVSSYPQPSTGVEKKPAGVLVRGDSASASKRNLDESDRDDDDRSASDREEKKEDKKDRRRRRDSSGSPERERRRRRDKSGGDSEKKEKKRSRRHRDGDEDGEKKEKKEKKERRSKKSKKEDAE
eukprot:TRINITY_DN7544_c1_g1_i1.p1 TRINITY_DN7544_c1_g1~~TRINITY_DN7544_c1_g1_i1.p1  ORF type:complete len:859 (+),score=245.02 TRINITY_DN7544_c1_g1_i1:188-2578(+)